MSILLTKNNDFIIISKVLIDDRYYDFEKIGEYQRNKIISLAQSIFNKGYLKNCFFQNNLSEIKFDQDKITLKVSKNKEETITDKKIVDIFKKEISFAKQYLQNCFIHPKEYNPLSDDEKKIVYQMPENIFQVRASFIKKFQKSDSEWSLWAAWGMELSDSFQNFCKFFDIKFGSISNSTLDGVGDLLGYFFSFIGLKNGFEMKRDYLKIEDKEGIDLANRKIARHLFSFAGSIAAAFKDSFYSIGENTKGITSFTATAIGMGFSIAAVLIFSIIALFASMRYFSAYQKSNDFENRLDSYLNNKNLSKPDKLRGVLNFLKSSVELSDNEILKIIQDIKKKNPSLSQREIKDLTRKESEKSLLVKIERFKRRLSLEGAAISSNKLDKLIFTTHTQKGVEKINKIINSIKEINRINKFENKFFSIGSFFQFLQLLAFAIVSLLIAMHFVHLPFLTTTISYSAFALGFFSSTSFAYVSTAYAFRRFYVKKKKDTGLVELEKYLKAIDDPSL